MGLFDRFGIFAPPAVIVKSVGHDRLPAFIHVNVANGLLSRLVYLRLSSS